MNMRKTSFLSLLAILVLLAACVAPAAPASEEQATTAYKLASIFPGPITDADYNTLGFLGTEAVKENLDIETAYSESVAVPDVDRVMREYIDDGFNIIFTHGGQFVNQTQGLAKEFPNVYFIAESDDPVADAPANFWLIDRNFQVGFYAVGALTALQTQTGKIGYIGGLTLPFSYAEVHAMEQAIADSGLDVSLSPAWVGDFNDPAKARELADAMIANGIDVIAGSLNLGMLGLFEAAKNATSDVVVVAKYTDKSEFAPDNYATSLLYDFAQPLQDIIGNIMAGETGGYYPLGFDTGVALQVPLQNVRPGVADAMAQILADLEGGKIQVVKNIEAIE